MFPVNLVIWLVPVLAPNEGEQLLREMDAKIIAARSIRIEFTIASHQGSQLLQGSLLLAERNRFRQELKSMDGPPSIAVSDGRQVVGRPGIGREGAMFPNAPLPEWHNQALQSWLGRGGTFLSLMAVYEQVGQRGGAKPEATDLPRTTSAKILPDQKINGLTARVVEYELSWTMPPAELRSAKVQVWIDPAKKVPLRRTMIFQGKTSQDMLIATHTKFELNPKLDDRLFELPSNR